MNFMLKQRLLYNFVVCRSDIRNNDMIWEYCHKALEKAEYRKLEDGTWFAEIPGFDGVWANDTAV
jgi:hypothetical protein